MSMPAAGWIDASYLERVERARRMSGEKKLLMALEQSVALEAVMKDGIRHQFPEADENEVREILRERLQILRRVAERK
jgi:hypothetical protein